MAQNWIQAVAKKSAADGKIGAFKKKADAAGMSTPAYAAKVLSPASKADLTTKRQANFAKNVGKLKHPGIGRKAKG